MSNIVAPTEIGVGVIENPRVTAAGVKEILKDYARNEEVIILKGQHGKTEPMAASVAGGIKINKGETVDFPEGFDYQDETGEKTYEEVQREAVARMQEIGKQYQNKGVFNIHESPHRNGGEPLEIDFNLVSRNGTFNLPELRKEFNELQQKLIPVGVVLNLSHISDRDSVYTGQDDFLEIPSNVVIVEVITSHDNYVTPEGGGHGYRLKAGREKSPDYFSEIAVYAGILEEVLPVVNAMHEKWIRH